jgi:hypothetical protein
MHPQRLCRHLLCLLREIFAIRHHSPVYPVRRAESEAIADPSQRSLTLTMLVAEQKEDQSACNLLALFLLSFHT